MQVILKMHELAHYWVNNWFRSIDFRFYLGRTKTTPGLLHGHKFPQDDSKTINIRLFIWRFSTKEFRSHPFGLKIKSRELHSYRGTLKQKFSLQNIDIITTFIVGTWKELEGLSIYINLMRGTLINCYIQSYNIMKTRKVQSKNVFIDPISQHHLVWKGKKINDEWFC